MQLRSSQLTQSHSVSALFQSNQKTLWLFMTMVLHTHNIAQYAPFASHICLYSADARSVVRQARH